MNVTSKCQIISKCSSILNNDISYNMVSSITYNLRYYGLIRVIFYTVVLRVRNVFSFAI